MKHKNQHGIQKGYPECFLEVSGLSFMHNVTSKKERHTSVILKYFRKQIRQRVFPLFFAVEKLYLS